MSQERFDKPSKSQLKREAKALQKLGEQLVGLSRERLDKLPLTGELRAAIDEARRIRQHGGRKRQILYVGKLLRDIDCEPIERALQRQQRQGDVSTAEFQRIERLRDQLVEEGDAALDNLLEQFPNADIQHVRQLVRMARQEHEREMPPKHARTLFRYLRDLAETLQETPDRPM